MVDLIEVDQTESEAEFKHPLSALRGFLDLDRAEGRRRHSIRRRRKILRRTLATGDALATILALVGGAVVFGEQGLTAGALGAVLILVLLLKVMGLYDRDEHLIHRATLDEVPALFEVATLGTLLIWLLDGWVVVGHIGRAELLSIWGLLFLGLVLTRTIARLAATRLTQPERCLVIGDEEAARSLRWKLHLDRSHAAQIVGRIPSAEAQSGMSNGTIPMLPRGLYRLLAEKADPPRHPGAGKGGQRRAAAPGPRALADGSRGERPAGDSPRPRARRSSSTICTGSPCSEPAASRSGGRLDC